MDQFLSNETLDDEASYYADTAMAYLTEIGDLKDEVANCSEQVEVEKVKQKALRQKILNTGGVISDLQRKLEQKELEIKQLKSALKSTGRPQISRPATPHVNPDEVTLRTRFIMQKVQEDMEDYQTTGEYEKLDDRIREIREIFGLVADQLRELHSKKFVVTKALKALVELNVSKNLYSLSFTLL